MQSKDSLKFRHEIFILVVVTHNPCGNLEATNPENDDRLHEHEPAHWKYQPEHQPISDQQVFRNLALLQASSFTLNFPCAGNIVGAVQSRW